MGGEVVDDATLAAWEWRAASALLVETIGSMAWAWAACSMDKVGEEADDTSGWAAAAAAAAWAPVWDLRWDIKSSEELNLLPQYPSLPLTQLHTCSEGAEGRPPPGLAAEGGGGGGQPNIPGWYGIRPAVLADMADIISSVVGQVGSWHRPGFGQG